MDDNELTIYILQQLRQGVPEGSIRAVLSQNGWPQPLVDRAFSMVQQARPHAVNPQIATEPIAPRLQEAELPTPSDQPYPVLEEEKKREKKSRLRHFFTSLAFLLAFAAIGVTIYYFLLREEPKSEESNKRTPAVAIDAKRKETVNQLANELLDYYKAEETYPTLEQINGSDFSTIANGFDISKYRDPSWKADNPACATQERVVLAESRAKGCITYRVTARSGGDCDAAGSKCTRVVLSTTLDDQKVFIVALDRNKRE